MPAVDSGLSSVLPDHEGPQPDPGNVAACARWRQVRAARLARERAPGGDPRWLFMRPAPKLTPALVFLLLTGEQATERLAGWVALAEKGGDDDTALRCAWANHWRTLSAQAQAAGFEPWGATRKRPTGPKVEAWRAAFLTAHAYEVPQR